MATDRRGAMWAAVAVAAVVIAGALIAGAVVRARDRQDGPTVLMIGDSVTYLSRNAITEAFDGTSDVDPQGRPGYRTDELVPLAKSKVDDEDPDTLVILTGYNDLTQGVDTRAAVGEMMDVAAGVPCAVWVLLPTKAAYAPEEATAFNQRIVDLAADHPDVHVATGWRDAVDATAGPDPDPALVTPDEIHPDEAGVARLGRVVEEAVTRDCG